jgi:CheY-like chemotaxis protein
MAPAKYKILILDDEQDLLDLYRDLLTKLPSQPDVHAANSGARALSLLEAEPYNLLVTDLNMPGMDGFQVLTIVRRRFPSVRTVVMTSVTDEQYRSRAYAMGIDLYLEKPNTTQEMKLFSDCIESLLCREDQGGFRGVQSKGLVDLIQIECLSQNSSVLRITNGQVEGRIWVENGDVVDAVTGELAAEEAFKKIMSWRTGNFEILPGEPARERRIFNNYQGLLLDSAQTMDEAQLAGAPAAVGEGVEGGPASALSPVTRVKGVEMAVQVLIDDKQKFDAWGTESPEKLAAWVHETVISLRALGDKLKVGELRQMEAYGTQRHFGLLSKPEKALCVGLHRTLSQDQVRDCLKEISVQWAS